MERRLMEIQNHLEELREIARQAVESSNVVENEAAAAGLLRNRMGVVAAAVDSLIHQVEKARVPPVQERNESSRQSTEESIRLAFSGMYMH